MRCEIAVSAAVHAVELVARWSPDETPVSDFSRLARSRFAANANDLRLFEPSRSNVRNANLWSVPAKCCSADWLGRIHRSVAGSGQTSSATELHRGGRQQANVREPRFVVATRPAVRSIVLSAGLVRIGTVRTRRLRGTLRPAVHAARRSCQATL